MQSELSRMISDLLGSGVTKSSQQDEVANVERLFESLAMEGLLVAQDKLLFEIDGQGLTAVDRHETDPIPCLHLKFSSQGSNKLDVFFDVVVTVILNDDSISDQKTSD